MPCFLSLNCKLKDLVSSISKENAQDYASFAFMVAFDRAKKVPSILRELKVIISKPVLQPTP